MDAKLDANGHAVVLVDEEYGYRYHVWYTGMTPSELEAYWSAIPRMADHYMDPTKTLPGEWQTAEFTDELDAWTEAKRVGGFYRAHIHWEDDSGLTSPDGRDILHAGYTSDRSQDE